MHTTDVRRDAFRTIIALALGAGIGKSADAQTAVVYGNLDVAATLSRAGGGAPAVKGLASGILNGSRWGISASEDLGDGLRTVLLLEAGFDVDSGAARAYVGDPSTATPTAPNGTPGTGFNRRSFLGFDGRYGTLTFGRDYTPVVYSTLDADIFRLGLFGSLQETVSPAGGIERWARVSNAVFYASPVVSGMRLRAAYSLGSESAGGPGELPARANRFSGVGVEYRYGALYVGGSYQALTYPLVAGMPAAFTGATAQREDAMIGGRYTIGSFAVAGGYWKVGDPRDANDAWIGASIDVGLWSVLTQVQRLRQADPAGPRRIGNVFGVGCVYSLSKRTALYASYGQVSNSANAAFPLTSNDTSIAPRSAGADPKALGTGVRHMF